MTGLGATAGVAGEPFSGGKLGAVLKAVERKGGDARRTGRGDRMAVAHDAGGIESGTLVAVGTLAEEFLQLLVLGSQLHEDLTATLTIVDEAPKFWR